jgi:ribose transport system ATP-binding protein
MADAPLLEMRGISKSFPGVRALDGVDLDLRASEVLALLGENGAGKSTLIKILGGAYAPDAGTIHLQGRPIALANPTSARRAGIAVMYQEFNLVPQLSARENIFLGRGRTTAGWIRHGAERREAADLFRRIGVAVDPDVPCARLSVAQQQAVEIAKALAQDARLLIMDEPTASLPPHEVDTLLDVVRDLRRQGIGILYVSHRLEEVFALADRVLVLRDGRRIDCRPVGEVTRQQLIEKMVGRPLESEFPSRRVEVGEPRLVVRDLRGGKVRGVSLAVRRGEILALTGLVGAGRTETVRLICGADPPESGTIFLDGRPLTIRHPRDAIRAGICLVPEDRKAQGLILEQSALENFALPNLPRFSAAGFLHRRRERAAFTDYVNRLRIKLTRPEEPVKNLSGGNQQKVVLARWLQAHAEVVLFDEPTRGIDVGAKHEIYLLMNDLAARGKAVLMVSSELPEVLGMADRILVLHEGRVAGEITDVARATQERIMDLAVR